LFEGVIVKKDAVELLGSTTKQLGKTLGVMNFGGNCAEGRWKMLETTHPFATMITASDLPVGGWNRTHHQIWKDNKTHSQHVTKEKARLSSLNILKEGAEAGKGLGVVLDEVLEGRRAYWKLMRKEIKRTKIMQSLSLYRSSEFMALRNNTRATVANLTDDQKTAAKNATEAHRCDVQHFLAAMPTTANASLVGKFQQLRSKYVSTKEFTDWKVDTNGLGFNFVGWNEPPCELSESVGLSFRSKKDKKKELDDMFDPMDSNGDGYLDKEELKNAGEEDPDKAIEDADSDGDGKISKREFGKAYGWR